MLRSSVTTMMLTSIMEEQPKAAYPIGRALHVLLAAEPRVLRRALGSTGRGGVGESGVYTSQRTAGGGCARSCAAEAQVAVLLLSKGMSPLPFPQTW